MGKLTKKRQAELMRQYPDADAIGHAIAQDFVDQQAESQWAGHQHALTQDEIGFLLEVLPKIAITTEEREAYNRYVRLRKALVKIINSWRFHFEMFMCHFYMIAYTFKGVSMGFKVLLFADEVPEDFRGTCIAELKNMDDSLQTTWGNFRFAMKALFYADFIMETLGEAFDLDFSPIRPNIEMYEQNFKEIQEKAGEVGDILTKYKKRRGVKNKIYYAPPLLVREIQHEDIDTLRITEDKAYIIKQLIETKGATAETMDDAVATIFD